MRVYEIAKQYEMSNKELMKILENLGIEASNAKSSLSPDDINIVNKFFNEEVKNKSSNVKDEESQNNSVHLLVVNKAHKGTESTTKKKKRTFKVKAKAKHVVGSAVVKHKETTAKKVIVHKVQPLQEETKENIEAETKIKDEKISTISTKEEITKNFVKEQDSSKVKDKNEIEQIVKNSESVENSKIETKKNTHTDKKEKVDFKFEKSSDSRNKNFEKKNHKKFEKKNQTQEKKDGGSKKIILNKGHHKKVTNKEHITVKRKEFDRKFGDKREKDKFKDKKTSNKFTSDDSFTTKNVRRSRGKATIKHEKTQIQEKEFHIRKKKSVEQKFNIPESIDIPETILVADLAKKMNIKSNVLIAKFLGMGELVTINQVIDAETAQLIADEFNCKVNIISLYEETVIEEETDKKENLISRPPIVTIMGHVDHGKTKLLDAIRSTNVVDSEFGGITQHIGAYKIRTDNGQDIVFLDTPGHEAFTSMRMRGAKVTDIVILVVAADDGVMPQTVEAINHAKSAKVPIIVAINKMDSPGASPDRVKQQLADYDLLADTWGGDIFMIEISALKHLNIEQLLETILFVSEDLDLKADPSKLAVGTVIESKIDPGRGPVATVIIQTGTLKISSHFVAGIYKGKVRAMFDDKGKTIKEADPSTPVEVLGIDGVPEAGDPFHEVKDDKTAKQYSIKRQEYKRHEAAKRFTKVTLDTLFGAIEDGYVKELNLIVRGDVQGSVEALKDYFKKLSEINKEVRVVVIHSGTGGINESDVLLASASNSIIIGFNVRANIKAAELANREKVEIRKYNIIYNVVEDIKAAMEGLLTPEKTENVTGQLEIREVFKISRIGAIAGCYVTNGYIKRNAKVRLIRNDIVIYTGNISSLKRFKDDVSQVKEGFECGLTIEKFNDIKVSDVVEAFEIKEVARKL